MESKIGFGQLKTNLKVAVILTWIMASLYIISIFGLLFLSLLGLYLE